MLETDIKSEEAMHAFAAQFADALNQGAVIHLVGDLGAGKTTWARGLLRAMGYTGKVKSPTYTLIEPYSLDGQTLYHMDLYRLADPEELEFLGIREINPNDICLVEWPEKGAGFLPEPDLILSIRHKNEGRDISIKICTGNGQMIIKKCGFNATK